jgi:hypothetical protein
MRLTSIFIAMTASAALYGDGLPWDEGRHGAELEHLMFFLPENPIILEAGAHNGEDTVNFIKNGLCF